MATLTFVYADQMAVLGPLSESAVPGAFDLCLGHAERTSAPKGWEVLRLPLDGAAPPPVPDDDLLALAEAVRAIGLRHDDPEPRTPVGSFAPEPVRTIGHLRLLPGV